MAVGEGKFLLYSHIDPPLAAGDYRFRTDQLLSGQSDTGARDADDLPVDRLDTHVRIRAPRYQLPPDQVLSTFPPANTEGAYGTRLAQVVIKRRTLPWERDLAGQPSTTPWLALVLIAEGEAELVMNRPVAECVTPGVVLPGVVDAELANHLKIRKSVIDKVFPTRKDVPLLVHAREVDIHDTELMMGDDDGFLAVVVANRLPVAGRDSAGGEVPVKYLACLVNLEGQFDALLPEAPAPSRFTDLAVVGELSLDVAGWDHLVSGHGSSDFGDAPTPKISVTPPAGAHAFNPTSAWSIEDAVAQPTDVYVQMAQGFTLTGIRPDIDLGVGGFAVLDPVHRFPVLLHWSFTSLGTTTFQRLMEDLDSALLGSLPDPPRPPTPGREPIEVVETGHVGLAHRTRRGDHVRSWYRGPLTPHPTIDAAGGRLALAHAADQLRIIVPDGREDVSLAAAFEIGRLLALARPGIVGSLLRWRRTGYLAARRRSIYEFNKDLLGELLGGMDLIVDHPLPHVVIGREFVNRVVTAPGDLLGPPRALFDPGRSLDIEQPSLELIGSGFALDGAVLTGNPTEMLEHLRGVEIPVGIEFGDLGEGGSLAGEGLIGGLLPTATVAATLGVDLDRQLTGLVADALAHELSLEPRAGPDALDRLMAEGRLDDLHGRTRAEERDR